MKKSTFIIFMFASSMLHAQSNLKATWLRHTCGYTNGVNLLGGNVWGDAVCADQFGNSYNSGSFSGNWFTMDTVIEMNNNRFYINKYNASGKRVWTAKAMGTTINSIMTASRMQCDSLGNVYVCGMFSVDDSVYMAPNWYPVGSGYVAKYDSNGNNLWCRYVPRTGSAAISFNDMTLVNGHIYICGIMNYGTQSFGSFNFNGPRSQNGMIAKLDLNGNILAAKLLDTSSVNEIYGIAVSKNTNHIYLVGQHISSNLKVNGITLNHTQDAQNSFILKMDAGFNAVWLKKCNTFLHLNQTVGSSIKCLKRIEIDKFDNLYAVASGNGDSTVIGSLKFSHRISPNGSYAQDIYIVKLNSNGQEIWLKHGASDGMDDVMDIAIDEWGNSILAVYSDKQSVSGLIFDNDTIQQWHGGLVKYDSHGNLLYAQKLQEARSLRALAMGKDSVFYGTGNGFNPGLPYVNLSVQQCEDQVNGYYNPPYKMVMVKFFDNSGNFSKLENMATNPFNSLNIYPNPVNDNISVKISNPLNEVYTLKITNSSGNCIKSMQIQNVAQIPFENQPAGIYYITITSRDMVKTCKMVKY